MMNERKKKNTGFTLIELLVVVLIVGILVTLVIFGLRQAQESARDGKRKNDLETIASALELYRSECNRYPTSAGFLTSGTLSGSGSPSTCTGVYLSNVPQDPQYSAKRYSYTPSGNGSSYVLCASLEQGGANVSGCGSCGSACNYRKSKP